MGILKTSADLVYTYRFLRLLTLSWEETDAFKLGIIDKDGKALKKSKELETSEERDAYTVFIRLVFNIKRLLNKVPMIGKSKLTSFAAAFFLIKEHTAMSEKEIIAVLEAYYDTDMKFGSLTESWMITKDESLSPGAYKLKSSMISYETGDTLFESLSTVIADNDCEPIDKIFGVNIYEVRHKTTGLKVYVTQEDITK